MTPVKRKVTIENDFPHINEIDPDVFNPDTNQWAISFIRAETPIKSLPNVLTAGCIERGYSDRLTLIVSHCQKFVSDCQLKMPPWPLRLPV